MLQNKEYKKNTNNIVGLIVYSFLNLFFILKNKKNKENIEITFSSQCFFVVRNKENT